MRSLTGVTARIDPARQRDRTWFPGGETETVTAASEQVREEACPKERASRYT